MKIISGFAGIGKTTAAKKNPRFLDLESSKFKWIVPEGLEQLSSEEQKGLSLRNMNPEWPRNYLGKILVSMEKTDDFDFIFISPSQEILDTLELLDVDFTLVFPSLDSKEEMLDRYRNRNNSEEFINKIDTKYEEIYHWLSSKTQNKIILKKGQYLSDILDTIR